MRSVDMINKQFHLPNGIKFTVLEVEFFLPDKVSKNYKRVLDFEPNQFVAVGYRGVLIPNITTEQGVARLCKVEVDGKVLDSPKAISAALGVVEAMDPVSLVL